MREELDIGQVLTNAFRVFWRNILGFLGAALLTYVIPFGLAMALGITTAYREFARAAEDPATPPDPAVLFDFLGALVPVTFLFAVLHQLLLGALSYVVVAQLRGYRATLGDGVRAVGSCLPILLVVSLLFGVGIFMGTLLCCLPGILLFTMWWVVVPVAVLETSDGWVWIDGPVKAGMRVVVRGAGRLTMAVRGGAQSGGHFHADGTYHAEAH